MARKKKNEFVIKGTVINQITRAGIAGLRVEAWDRDLIVDDLVASAVTDAQGTFTITFDESYYSELFLDRRPDLYFKVFRGAVLIKNTKNITWWNANESNADVMIEIEASNTDQPAPSEPTYRVYGVVRDGNNNLVQDLVITAFDRDLRTPQRLGTSKTDASGVYSISYGFADFQRGDAPLRRSPWLIVELQAANSEVLATQEVQKASREQVVSFKLANINVVSEWQRLSDAICPILQGSGVNAADLTPADVDFIARDTELDRFAVDAWAASSKMLQQAVLGFNDEQANEQAILRDNGGSFFFGLARQGLASTLEAVLRGSSAKWQQTWRAARAAIQVPLLNDEQLHSVLNALVLLQRLQQLNPETSSNSEFARVLASNPLPLPNVVALDALTIYQEKGLRDVDAFLELEKRHPESAAPIKTFVRGVRVHQLVAGDAGFSRVLNARLKGTSDSIEPLAVLPSVDWLGMAGEASVTQGHALRVQAQIEKQHPLTALQARLNGGQLDKLGVSNKEITAFITKDGALADSILRGKTPAKSRIDKNAPEIHKVLDNLGLFARSGLSMEMTGKLMQAGIKTPAAAVRYGRSQLRDMWLDQIALDTANEIGNHVISNAEATLNGANGFVLNIQGSMFIQGSFGYMFADPAAQSKLPDSVRENLPTLPGLFGDMDECICKPCESMLGQPAYLVDLLMLLGKDKLASSTLELRRPDIQEMPLSCENADTVIQHIEIVLEILERAVAKVGVPTTLTRSEIQAIAYPKLAGAIYSWGLPFDLHYAEIKSYLNKLGVSRADLQSLLPSPELNVLAAETLDVTFARTNATSGPISEWQLLTEQRRGSTLWAAYGFDRATGITIVDPASNEKLVDQNVEDILVRASFLIARTGLSFEELRQTLATPFVAGYEGGIRLSNTDQCKTSQMRLPAEGSVLEEILDRLHRFVRLRKKLPDWSVEQLGKAFEVLNGMEDTSISTTDAEARRVDLLLHLATIKRLHELHSLSIDHLLALPGSISRLRQSMGLSALEFSILKKLTAFNSETVPFNWTGLEELCNVNKSIRDSGLSIEQIAETLLSRDQLIALAGELPPSIKSEGQIEALLLEVQQRLRDVVVTRTNETPEAQATEVLTAIFDTATADRVVNAIRVAGALHNPVQPNSALFVILQGATGVTHKLGEWLPLASPQETSDILTVTTTANLSANERFEKLLNCIAARRRERELISVIAEQCGQSESEVTRLLSSRLLLDDVGAQSTTASDVFLNQSFWADISLTQPTAPSVNFASIPRLYGWMDRLYRLTNLCAALNIDAELMQIADRVRVGTVIGINWRDMLAAPLPTNGSLWVNANWQALLDMVWLQKPEQLSRAALHELLARLTALASNRAAAVLITDNVVRPLATRVELTETKTLAIAAQALSVAADTDNFREPSKLRRVFSLLLLARRLDADASQLVQLANVDDNEQAVTTAKELLQPRFGAKEWKSVLRKIEDPIRQQQRDALVAYLVCLDNNDSLRNANDLYERYLIDPQMEPCFETTRIVEAITAVQLLSQRILFGLEDGTSASKELKSRWTWMRNYRVWEANRKVFLFPENWLFPELRDDKSSSFKQLESALGQGELTQELAAQSFGQFLDDVAQMGQMEVLGMYEDISRDSTGDIVGDMQPDKTLLPKRRTLYVVSRTLNPPYNYFWRSCEHFGSDTMEWAPWQRIELDIQGDHVLPFVLGGQLYVAWPLIRRIKGETPATDAWEVKLAWSRHDGKSWRKSSISREFWSDKAAAFTDERRGFAFRVETTLDESTEEISAKVIVYVLANKPSESRAIDSTPSDRSDPAEWGSEAHPATATNVDNAYYFLDTLIKRNYSNLPPEISKQLEIYAYWRKYFDGTERPILQGVLLALMERGSDSNDRKILFSNPVAAASRFDHAPLPNEHTKSIDQPWREASVVHFLWDYWADANRTLPGTATRNDAGFNVFYNGLLAISSRRIVICRAWIKLRAPDSTGNFSLVKLTGAATEGVYSCVVGGESIPFAPDQPNFLSWKLGDQASVACSLTLRVNWNRPATQTTPARTSQIQFTKTIDLAAIVAGKETTQCLYIELDGTTYNDGSTTTAIDAIDIGFDLDDGKVLLPATEFHLTRDDSISRKSPVVSAQLYSPVDSTQPWMNGFREISTEQDRQPVRPLKISSSSLSSQTSIFDPTKSSQFLALGSATSRRDMIGAVPISTAWHYSESDRGCYVDLGYRDGLVNSGLLVYPDSYPEATVRRSDWFRYQPLPLEQASQFLAGQTSSFGTQELPIPLIGSTVSWLEVQSGDFAFDARLPYACYNWEVFFHAPLLIADQLSKQHKFEDAERWLRYVFDPTSGGSGGDAKRFLKFRVFNKLNLDEQVIDDLTALAQVASGLGDAASVAAVKSLIDRWRDAPFRPFLIARRRHIAFLWRTLFAYLDNLIAWADSLYRRDTRESINEATMLYVLAERILGRRPQLHEDDSNRPAYNYNQKISDWDDFANSWINVGTQVSGNVPTSSESKDGKNPPNPDGMLYFCMPFNDKILSYWDIVEARLSNVRNCRNIDGITRSLPLMDAPIDLELLIRATAAGLDLSEVISGLYAPPPHYRYSILSARAAELANEAKALGAAMLSAIEKRDAEHLAQLRSSNEISLLTLVQEVRTLQITEAESNIEALRGSRRTISSRYEQYQRLLGGKGAKAPKETESAGEESMLGRVDDGASGLSHLGLIDAENKHIEELDIAHGWTVAGGVTKGVAGAAHMSASILYSTTGGIGSEVLKSVGTGLSTVGDMFDLVSRGWQHSANKQSILGGHIRRRDEWAFQSNQTLRELQQIDKQILANQIRIDITKKELSNHIQQIEQAMAVDEVMRSKFSNEQLYEWMRTQLYSLYSSGYRMALDMARRAERAAARELGVKPLNILGNGYWESQRDGLLAGERLHQDIKRLEVLYLDQNRREFELTKHISLRRLNPEALVRLRITQTERLNGQDKKYNKCEFGIPEWLFDLDTPGHYLRRIKSVSVSIPGVVGPFASVNCKLTLLNSHVRHEPRLLQPASATASRYKPLDTGDDPRFTDYYGATESVVTSTASGDSGLFETQLRDERFLPFEGNGVISGWRLELPGEYPQFDYSTISDVVLSIRYTARDGGDVLRDEATKAIATDLASTSQAPLRFNVLLSARSDFPTQWANRNAPSLTIPITSDLLPYWMSKLHVQRVLYADIVKEQQTQVSFEEEASFIVGAGSVNFAIAVPAEKIDRWMLLEVGKS